MIEQNAAPRVSVVVPVKNEAPNVLPLLEEIARACAAMPFETIYVDDGSTDATVAELEKARATRPWLRILRHQSSCGQSAAVRTGVLRRRRRLPVTQEIL